jgi:signal transduction histidine kinase
VASAFGQPGMRRREPPGRAPQALESEIKQWLARELHDTVSSTLTTMLIQMEQLQLREKEPSLRHGSQPTNADLCAELQSFQDSTRQALSSLRMLLQELRKAERVPLPSFIESVRGVLDRFERRTGIACRLTAAEGWPAEMGGEAAQHLVRITQEALQNVHCHSAASSVDVSLERAADVAIMTISDDGVGLGRGPAKGGGFGLIGMRERTLLVGGELRLHGTPGQGTMVQASFPVERLS